MSNRRKAKPPAPSKDAPTDGVWRKAGRTMRVSCGCLVMPSTVIVSRAGQVVCIGCATGFAYNRRIGDRSSKV